jgi:hypothetical protein
MTDTITPGDEHIARAVRQHVLGDRPTGPSYRRGHTRGRRGTPRGVGRDLRRLPRGTDRGT